MIGGGSFQRENWINLDYPFPARAHKQKVPIDVEHNLMSMKPFPLPDNHFEAVYSEHCIEHLTMGAAMHTLRECHRILKPGGTIRISCPDARKLFDFYKLGHYEKLCTSKSSRSRSPEYNMVDLIYSPMAGVMSDQEIRSIAFEKLIGKMEESEFSIEEQAQHPGLHLTWWTLERMVIALQFDGFQSVGRMEARQSRCTVLAESWVDCTAPEISLRVEGTK